MSFQAVRGTRDILSPEVEQWQRIEAVTRRVFGLYGLREIRTPIFEGSGVFEKGTGEASEIVVKEMYRFVDQGGNDLTLRPEGTPPVVRAYLEHHLGQGKDITRFWYGGPMFRYERPQKGRFRQFHQIGVELFGSESATVDAEVIDLGLHWLGELGVRDPRLVVNSVGDATCRPGYRNALVEAQRQVLDRLCEDCRRRHEVNPLRVFDCKRPGCQAVVAELPTILEHLCDGCRSHLDTVRSLLEAWGVDHELSGRLVRGLDYYRRTVFEITSDALGAQDALLGGGRYDGLVARMGGDDVPGIGFAAGVERIALAMPAADEVAPLDGWVVTVDRDLRDGALALARELRRSGLRCTADHQDRSVKAQMKAANRSGAAATLILGPDEVAAGVVTVRWMATGEEETVPRGQVAARLGAALAAGPARAPGRGAGGEAGGPPAGGSRGSAAAGRSDGSPAAGGEER